MLINNYFCNIFMCHINSFRNSLKRQKLRNKLEFKFLIFQKRIVLSTIYLKTKNIYPKRKKNTSNQLLYLSYQTFLVIVKRINISEELL